MAVTMKDISDANDVIAASEHVSRTPLVCVDRKMFGVSSDVKLYLKMESMQNTGSFKIRGIVNQIHKGPEEIKKGEKSLITMSAGNYGRAFAYMCKELNLKGHVVMPNTAPDNRVELIRSHGLEVELVPSKDIMVCVDKHSIDEGMLFMHPFDDTNLIAGYGSIGLEILEDLPDVDVVLVPCGGGGLVSGISSALKLSEMRPGVRVIAVEPERACTMYLSLKECRPVTKGDAHSIAGGLAPPFAGAITYEIVSKLVDEVVLVSDDEIRECVKVFYKNGLVAEPSGVAGFTALMFGKVGDVSNKKVAVIVSGKNIVPNELDKFLSTS